MMGMLGKLLGRAAFNLGRSILQSDCVLSMFPEAIIRGARAPACAAKECLPTQTNDFHGKIYSSRAVTDK